MEVSRASQGTELPEEVGLKLTALVGRNSQWCAESCYPACVKCACHSFSLLVFHGENFRPPSISIDARKAVTVAFRYGQNNYVQVDVFEARVWRRKSARRSLYVARNFRFLTIDAVPRPLPDICFDRRQNETLQGAPYCRLYSRM